jgi:hypothetical protein
VENMKVAQLSPEDLESLYKAFEGKRHRYCDFSEISKWSSGCESTLDPPLMLSVGYKYYEGLDDSD